MESANRRCLEPSTKALGPTDSRMDTDRKRTPMEARIMFFLKNGLIPASFLVYFRSFHIPIQMTNIQFELYKLKKE